MLEHFCSSSAEHICIFLRILRHLAPLLNSLYTSLSVGYLQSFCDFWDIWCVILMIPRPLAARSTIYEWKQYRFIWNSRHAILHIYTRDMNRLYFLLCSSLPATHFSAAHHWITSIYFFLMQHFIIFNLFLDLFIFFWLLDGNTLLMH